MLKRRHACASAGVALAFLANAAVAERAAPARTEGRRAEFRADSVVLEPNDEVIALEGHVVVVADRYRLTSDRLRLSRGPRGIVVEGDGRVSLCPCPDPPVSFGFQAATVAPPTDLLLEGPTLRVGGVPVFWLPYLWLRAPSRVGLLPLRMAYRGDDGVFLGSGVHVPLKSGPVVELGAGGYLRGGAEVDARVVTTHTTSSVRWDAFHGSAVAIDARGYDERTGGGSVAYSVDALRGSRALVGPSALEEVALRRDRARFFAGGVTSGFVAGIAPRAELARGGAYDVLDAAGPGAFAGYGTSIGEIGDLDVSVGAVSYRRPGGTTTSVVAPRAQASIGGTVGPAVVSAAVRGRAISVITEDEAPRALVGSGTIVAEVPFVKTFGEKDALQHWVVPRVLATFAGFDGGSFLEHPLPTGTTRLAAAGLRTTLGETDERRAAISIDGHAAAIATGRGESFRVVTARTIASAWGAAASLEGTSSLRGGQSDSVLAVLRLGPERGPFIGGHAEGLRGEPLLVTRGYPRGDDAPLSPWFAVPGWSVGGRLGVPWTRALATTADVDFDATRGELLAARGSAAYRHACGCLAVALWAGHRLGRGPESVRGLSGIDAFLTVDLMPTSH